MKFSFTKPEIDILNKEANWTEEEKNIFDMLISPRYHVLWNDPKIYMKLDISHYKFYKIKANIESKILRVLREHDMR